MPHKAYLLRPRGRTTISGKSLPATKNSVLKIPASMSRLRKKVNSCLFTLAITVVGSGAVCAQSKSSAIAYKNKDLAIQLRVNDLLKRMTLLEKAGQLNQLNGGILTGPGSDKDEQQQKVQLIKEGKVGSLLNTLGVAEIKKLQKEAVEQSRLKIPLLYGFDIIHGYKTLFPIPLAEACSWDMEQVIKDGRIAAKESAASGLNWGFAPMCDIYTDPRWGRVMEGAGEDPYYGGVIAAARVKGFQGKLDGVFDILACVKHFAVYGAVEAGREYNNVDVSRVALWNKYLPPYAAAIKAGAATVMTSFNVVDGVPASGNAYLLTDVLKNKWGFKGFVVSDWNAFAEMIPHGFAADKKDAVAKALRAGSMMDMESRSLVEFLPQLVKEGKVSVEQVDKAVAAILYYKFKLGLFEDPYRFLNEQREAESILTAENRQVARDAAKKSIVLLKNNNQTLPLKNLQQKIALIGYYANSKEDMLDMWKGMADAKDCVSIYEGLKAKLPNLSFAPGYAADNSTSEKLLAEAVKAAEAADVVVVNIGISGTLAGEDKSLADINIPDGQVQLLKALRKTGKPIISLVSSGRPLILTPVQDLSDALVQCWQLGTETGNAVAEVVLGGYNPSAKTVMSFPYAIGQIPVYYNHFNTGRPGPARDYYSRFHDIPNEPLYPFGYGLSYTSFEYGNPQLSATAISGSQALKVAVELKNTGKYDGEEVVQLYIQDVAASIVRPVKELKGYRKLMLKAGEKTVVNFTIEPKELAFFDQNGNAVIEKGKFRVFVGGNSRDVKQAEFELN